MMRLAFNQISQYGGDSRYEGEEKLSNLHLFQPVWVWERQVGECSLSLYKVPRSPDVVVPGDDSLHWVPHHVDVYWHVKIKPEEFYILLVCIGFLAPHPEVQSCSNISCFHHKLEER